MSPQLVQYILTMCTYLETPLRHKRRRLVHSSFIESSIAAAQWAEILLYWLLLISSAAEDSGSRSRAAAEWSYLSVSGGSCRCVIHLFRWDGGGWRIVRSRGIRQKPTRPSDLHRTVECVILGEDPPALWGVGQVSHYSCWYWSLFSVPDLGE